MNPQMSDVHIKIDVTSNGKVELCTPALQENTTVQQSFGLKPFPTILKWLLAAKHKMGTNPNDLS